MGSSYPIINSNNGPVLIVYCVFICLQVDKIVNDFKDFETNALLQVTTNRSIIQVTRDEDNYGKEHYIFLDSVFASEIVNVLF